MITRVRDNNVKRNIRIVTQQYDVGFYFAVYDNDSGVFIDQFGIDMSEEEYHNALREKYKDNLID